MIVNREYIIERTNRFVKEQQTSNQQEKERVDKLYLIKLYFPKWLRKMIFHPLNPIYSIYLQCIVAKQKKGRVPLESLHNYATDFLDYFIKNDLQFDTSLYFDKENEQEIELFIDNRIKSLLSGYTTLPMSEKQKQMLLKKTEMSNLTKKISGGYSLTIDNYSHQLPYNSFQEYAFIHDYGLKHVPSYVREYISNKDFLDVGAYWGDTAILFLKYKPSHIYAYEPVKENIKILEQAITFCATDKITAVQKGIGDKESEMNIFVNPLNLSSCSINETATNQNLEQETIQVTTIDNESRGKTIGLIKMDIEGFEYSAIQGALETIKRDKPVLIISIYHTAKDFFEIPPIIKDLDNTYIFQYVDLEVMKPLIDKVIVAYPKQ